MSDREKFAVAVRVPGFGLSYCEARWYGWRHCIHIGRWIVFFGPINFDFDLEMPWDNPEDVQDER